MTAQTKIIVLDDDPTGSQTVHSCLLLTRWDVSTLEIALRDSAPIFFVLTNTRALTPDRALAVTREVCQNLVVALKNTGIGEYMVVSRSDSTLRGHYPIETDAIAQVLGNFDAHFLTPAFFEGGRFTKDSIHYLIVNGVPTPVHETEFAQDSVFGYSHSYLPAYVEEKTQGKIRASQVERLLLSDIRQDCYDRLMQLGNNTCVVVDAETQADMNRFADSVLRAVHQGKRFLFRSAASLLTALAQLPPQPIPPTEMSRYRRSQSMGAVLVGSHVRKTTQQLERLLAEPDVAGIELPVAELLQPNGFDQLLATAYEQIQAAYQTGKTPVIFTSRQELQFPSVPERMQFGQRVSHLLMTIVQHLPPELSFLISKGGITSNDVLSTGLSLPTARLLGQIIPGCSVITTPPDHPLFPNLPVVLFPGNVGDESALALVYRRLQPRQ
ncbi:MAG: four-carbon acid sugar kinase family protein [Pseudanabaenaceae cyanobacterium]